MSNFNFYNLVTKLVSKNKSIAIFTFIKFNPKSVYRCVLGSKNELSQPESVSWDTGVQLNEHSSLELND